MFLELAFRDWSRSFAILRERDPFFYEKTGNYKMKWMVRLMVAEVAAVVRRVVRTGRRRKANVKVKLLSLTAHGNKGVLCAA